MLVRKQILVPTALEAGWAQAPILYRHAAWLAVCGRMCLTWSTHGHCCGLPGTAELPTTWGDREERRAYAAQRGAAAVIAARNASGSSTAMRIW